MNMVSCILFLLWTFVNHTCANDAHTIWKLDFGDFCNKTLQWSCAGVSYNYNQSLLPSQCGNQQCIFFDAFMPQSSITISDISTLNRVNITLSYTLTLNASTNETDVFIISALVNGKQETVAIHGGDIVEEEFIVELHNSTFNQTAIDLTFDLVGSPDGDVAYLLAARLYEPSEEGHERGLQYDPVHVYLLAAGMGGGALLIVVYFRVCRTRVECCQKRCNLERCGCTRKKGSISEIVTRSGSSPSDDEKEGDGKEQATEQEQEKEKEKQKPDEDKPKDKSKEKEKEKDNPKKKEKNREKAKVKDKEDKVTEEEASIVSAESVTRKKNKDKTKGKDKEKEKDKEDKVTEEETNIMSEESMVIAAELNPKLKKLLTDS